MKHHARILRHVPGFDLSAELLRMGEDERAARHAAKRADSLAIRLDDVPSTEADRLRQCFRAAGAAIARGPGDESGRPVLIVAGRAEAELALHALSAQRDALRELAREMTRALESDSRAECEPLPCGDHLLEFGRRTLVMAIVNTTPDSFSQDGTGLEAAAGIERARQAFEQGADIIDIGGESTRPGSETVSLTEELRRTIPVVEAAAALGVPVSIDTSKAEVARAAIEAGASIINDVTALRGDPEMARVAAEAACPVVLMHMLGRPRTMQDDPQYDDVVSDVYAFLADRTEAAIAAGIDEARIIIDPGFGFGKRLEHNLELLRRLREFRSLGRPIIAGTSRKSMIGMVLDLPVDQRVEGTAATVACAIQNGADIVRVHDVQSMCRVARMTDAICRAGWQRDE